MGVGGQGGARLSRALACGISRSTALRMLMCQVATPLRVPRVLGIDDFALKRRHRYATVIIDAETGERIDVLPDRTAQTLTTWPREHPGAQYVCSDGSATYAESIRQALPEAVQVSDRWHLWSNLCGKVLAEVRSHGACWATVVNPTRPGGAREQTTRERRQRVRHLLGQGVASWKWAHMLGFRGQFSTKSYSTTLGALRAARRAWRTEQTRAHAGLPEPDPDTTHVIGHWAYLGTGYSPGAAFLAAPVRHRWELERRFIAEGGCE